MEPNRNNDQNKSPEGNRPKSNIATALLITLALALVFSWVMNTVKNSQYTETTWSDFCAAKEAGQLSEVEIEYDRVVYMTKEDAAKEPSQQKASFTGLTRGGDSMELAT